LNPEPAAYNSSALIATYTTDRRYKIVGKCDTYAKNMTSQW